MYINNYISYYIIKFIKKCFWFINRYIICLNIQIISRKKIYLYNEFNDIKNLFESFSKLLAIFALYRDIYLYLLLLILFVTVGIIKIKIIYIIISIFLEELFICIFII